MKLLIKNVKLRNPFVALSLRRKAGPHRAGNGARRLRGRIALRLELDRLVKASP